MIQVYNSQSKKIDNEYIKILRNTYFKKTINHIFFNLTPRYEQIDYSVKSGQTLRDILKEFSVKDEEIKKIFAILSKKETNKIRSKQVLNIVLDNTNKNIMDDGYLKVILGCMYAGKTSKLINIYKMMKFSNISTLVVNYKEDTRYSNTELSTHDKKMIPCVQCLKLMELVDKTGYIKEKVIIINEGQFFPDLTKFVKLMLDKDKHIYVCGLDGDFKRNEFDQIIIPEHDITKKVDKNVITTFGSLVDLKKFEKNKKICKPLDTPKKKISFFIGGNGKSSKILPKELEGTIKILNFLSKEYEVYYCFSRRTPINIKNMIMQKAAKKNLFFPQKQINPYWFLLNISEYIFVTADSISMLSDSLSSGKKVYIVPIKKIKTKIKTFSELVLEKKMAKLFNCKLENWKYKRLFETNKVCKKLIKVLNL